jgi:hypothetical protein
MDMKSTSFSPINGWREILARVFEGFETEYGIMPEWLVNPETHRRLKLDYFYPEISVAVRFVGLEATGRRQRKSDEEVDAEARREEARTEVCREHGVILVSIELDGEPRAGVRGLETGLARASSQLARSQESQARKQKLMPRLSEARRRAGELSTRLTVPERLNLYAEMWRDREASLSAQPQKAKAPIAYRPYEPGMQVMHERFGYGRVESVEPDDTDVRVTVLFDDLSERVFYASLVGGTKLQIVSD